MLSTSTRCAGPWFRVYINILGGKKNPKAMQTAITHWAKKPEGAELQQRRVREGPKAGTRRAGPSGCSRRGPSPAARPGKRLRAPERLRRAFYLSWARFPLSSAGFDCSADGPAARPGEGCERCEGESGEGRAGLPGRGRPFPGAPGGQGGSGRH